MGDHFQTFVDPVISLSEAPILAAEIQAWLEAAQIIIGPPSNCVLNGDGQGYRPGQFYRSIVEETYSHFLDLKINGVSINVGRIVYHPTQTEIKLICNNCQARNEHRQEWGEAITGWLAENDQSIYTCFSCGFQEDISTWQFEPPWGFGNLGIVFWNWPKLKSSFVEQLAQKLGHWPVQISDKL